MVSRRFCVRCGSEEGPNNPIIDGLCVKCFTKERKLVELPNVLKVSYCPSCGSVLIKGSWVPTDGDELEAVESYVRYYVIEKAKKYPGLKELEAKVIDMSEGRTLMEVSGKLGNALLIQTYSIDTRISKRTCPRCAKVRGGHFEAVIQIRSATPWRREAVISVVRKLERVKGLSENIVEIEETKDGYDIKLLSQAIARHAATILRKELGAKITQTWKDAGYVSGKKHSKLTIAARVPGLMSGDIVSYGERLSVVTRVSHGKIWVKDLESGRIRKLGHDDIWSGKLRYVRSKEYAIIEGRILAYEGGKAVVQTTNGNIRYVRTPILLDIGTPVKLLVYKGKSYLII
jgi:nonsense-mediated mRNA decay protein 3